MPRRVRGSEANAMWIMFSILRILLLALGFFLGLSFGLR